jgi:hypothetical protein
MGPSLAGWPELRLMHSPPSTVSFTCSESARSLMAHRGQHGLRIGGPTAIAGDGANWSTCSHQAPDAGDGGRQ